MYMLYITGFDPGDMPLNADVHPVYGPLPGFPPPTSAEEQHSRQNHHVTHPPPVHTTYTTQAQQYHTSGASAHVSTNSGSHGNQVQGQNTSPPKNHHNGYTSVASSRMGTIGTTNRPPVNSTSSSWGAHEIGKGMSHPSPPFLLSHSDANIQNGTGTASGALPAASYYSNQHPHSTTTVKPGTNYQSLSKGFPHNYPQLPLNGVTTTNQQLSKGTTHHQFPPSYQQQRVATGSTNQHPYSPSWPSVYSSGSSQEQSSYSYASFHNTSSTNGGAQPPVMPHPPGGHMITPSYSESSGTSSSYAHTGGSSSSNFSSAPAKREERFKDEEKTVEPNILKFTYPELSEATDGFVKGMVGLGSFGTVFRAKIRGNGPYAVKKLYSVSAHKINVVIHIVYMYCMYVALSA